MDYRRSKCAKNTYDAMLNGYTDGLINPYCYNFGRVERESDEISRIFHIKNENLFGKK